MAGQKACIWHGVWDAPEGFHQICCGWRPCLRLSFTLTLGHCLQALHGGGQHELAKDALGTALNLFRASSNIDLESIANCEMLRTSIDEALTDPKPVEGEEE